MAPESDTGVETLLVGIDAACPRVLDELFEADVTPNLEAFFDAGASGPLASQLPPWTPSAWPSIYTGVNPGKHGVFGFLRFRGYEWDVVDYEDVREFSIWELLGEQGKQSVVVNVPVTGPPRSFPGALVPGYVAPEDPVCHPDGLLDDLRDEVPDYRVYPPDADSRDEQLRHYRDCISSRVEAFDYLVDRFAPDFGFVQFQVCDTVFHQYPGDWDAVESVYGAVDEAFGRLLDDHDPETVLVASDHGIGEYAGYEFRVNEYLADRGYVETTRDGSGMPSWSSIARQRFHDDDDVGSVTNAVEQAARRAIATAARAGVTADRVYRYLDWVGLAEPVAERLDPEFVRAGTRRVDFGESIAFMRDRIELGVRLNVIGREPDGVVPPDDYDSVRTELVDALERAQTPAGNQVFERVLPREAVFHGPYVDEAPDLIVVPAGFDQFLSASLRGDTFAEPTESWNHKPTGSVAIAGPNVDQEQSVRDAGVLDIAPTICSSVGVPVPNRMDGEALTVVPTPAREQYPPYPHGGGGEARRRLPVDGTDPEPIGEIE
ncbi:alkaline phosphatase family protein [Haloarchaeobius salinus]|uniref:alkaline phosphatase family protein n=1 Tax=Haloarchaeobius salinus TaxID=1198298 RepID=UPI00210C64DD|nr:alkaline phosphatase family protein [Haloarchaeobius salinus]